MTLTPNDRKAIIAYRLEKAHATMSEARYTFDGGFWSLTANRLYYALFYACEALLLKNRMEVSSHAGVGRMISLNFVRTQILTPDDSKLLKTLFQMRQTGDYNDLYDWSENQIKPLLNPTEELISRIERLIIED